MCPQDRWISDSAMHPGAFLLLKSRDSEQRVFCPDRSGTILPAIVFVGGIILALSMAHLSGILPGRGIL